MNLVIADSSEVFIEGIKSWIHDRPEIILKSTCNSWDNVPDPMTDYHVNIIISRYNWISQVNRVELTQFFYKNPDINYYIFWEDSGTELNSKMLDTLLKIGFRGFFSQKSLKEEFLFGILNHENHKPYVSKDIFAQILVGSADEELKPWEVDLTNRELEIIQMIVQGFMNKEIADKLSISKRTVEMHRSHILAKLGMKNSALLVKFAILHLKMT